jgi:hypothetical protein
MSYIGEEAFKEHRCSGMPKDGVDVVFSRNGNDGDNSVWNLIIRKEASKEDLEENHYLEEVGEIIWETILEISHCPYCGEALGKTGTVVSGKPIHRDYSGWSVTIM